MERERQERLDNKFYVWATGYGNPASERKEHGYYRRENKSSGFRTDKFKDYNEDEWKRSSILCNNMMMTNRNQVVRDTSGGPSVQPPSLARSVSSATFIDFMNFKGLDPEQVQESMKAAFESFARESDGTISLDDAKKVVKMCIGDDTPEFILDKFSVLCWKISAAQRIYWVDFKKIIHKAIKAADADCSVKREMPPLVQLMTKPRMHDKALGPFNQACTIYSDTYNFDGKAAQKKLLDEMNQTIQPGNALLTQTRKMALNPATKVLCAGSVKGTNQLPGYCGHMPSNLRNQRKVEHSFGLEMRPTINNLMLTQRGMGCVLGYQGYVPKPSLHVKFNERVCGMDPRSSVGAAFGPERRIL